MFNVDLWGKINHTVSKINLTANYLNKGKSLLRSQTIEKSPLWAGAAPERCFSTNPPLLTYFCEDGPAELSANCSGDPPRETLILAELSNRAKPRPNAPRCRMIDFLCRESPAMSQAKYVTHTHNKTKRTSKTCLWLEHKSKACAQAVPSRVLCSASRGILGMHCRCIICLRRAKD